MRIPVVQNFNCNSYTKTNANNSIHRSNLLTNSMLPKFGLNYKNDLKNGDVISFTGVQPKLGAIVKVAPLEDRLASIFQVTNIGDLVVAGPSLKEVQKSLRDSVDVFSDVIKKMFFVKDSSLDGTMAFLRNGNYENEFVNVNKFNIELNSSLGNYTMKPKDTFYLENGDTLSLGQTKLKFKKEPDVDLSLVRDKFAQVFDFSDIVQPAIEKENKKSFKLLLKNDKTSQRTLSFKDVGGQDNVISELKKGILYPIKYPEAYENHILNKGFILSGPPGTGKTLIAEALANESDAYYKKLNGLELESKWVGESEDNLRNLFKEAIDNQPSVIFFDEFDAIARKRGGHDVYGDKFVNQFLTLMSDIEKNGDSVYVIAATNKLDALDSAITRSGRFGKHIEVPAPDLSGVKQILDIHTARKPLADDVDKEKLANKLFDLKSTGADIAHIVNSAHSQAFERLGVYEKMENGTFTKADAEGIKISQEDFERAMADFSKKLNVRRPIGYKN